MDKKIGLLLLIGLGVVLAGCIGGTPQNPSNPNGSQQVSSSSGGGKTSIILENGKINMTAIGGIADLEALDVGIKCTAEQKEVSNGTVETNRAEYYVKGKDFKLVGNDNGEKYEEITKHENGKTYIYMKVQNLPAGCEWIKLESEGNIESAAPYLGSVNLHYQSPNSISVDQSWSCQVAQLTDSDFTPDGKVCTLQDIINAQLNQIQM